MKKMTIILYCSALIYFATVMPSAQEIEGVFTNPIRYGITDDHAIMENSATGIKLDVNIKSGAYRIERDKKIWIGDGVIVMRIKGKTLLNVNSDGSASGEMRIVNHNSGNGTDLTGDYKFITLQWEAASLRFATEFRMFETSPHIEFLHSFPDGYSADETGKFEETALNFPVFVANSGGDDLHLFSYSYPIWPSPLFGQNVRKTFIEWGDGAVRTPLLIFDDKGGTGILSPLNDCLVRIVRILDLTGRGFVPAVAVGLSGEIKMLKPGHISKSILLFGNGITAAMKDWGDVLLLAGGKNRVAKDASFTLKYLGYWTDNGAYYYYRTEPDKNYETTLLEMGEYIKDNNIPIGYFQMDSWWYPKSKIDNGMMVWEPMQDYFPSGFEGFQKKLGFPLIFHNRYFAVDTPYQERMPFIKGEKSVHPAGREIFDLWGDQIVRWNGKLYEQDWLGTQYNKVSALRDNPETASAWLANMAGAMQQRGLDIQYCMPTIGFYLASTLHQNVTNIRSSNDYIIRLLGQSNKLWLEHGYTSALAWALGLFPFKDVFISNSPPEDLKDESPAKQQLDAFKLGSRAKRESPAITYEPNFQQEALLSVLSAGPAGIGDKIGLINKSLVEMMADEEGLLIKPDEAMIPIERMFYKNPQSTAEPFIGHTFSTVSQNRWHYILGLNIYIGIAKENFRLTPADLALEGNYILYDFRENTAAPLDENFLIEARLKPLDFVYYILAPRSPQGRALIGDIGKFVTASASRIVEWSDQPVQMDIQLKGPKGTKTLLLIFSPNTPQQITSRTRNLIFNKVADINALDEGEEGWSKTGDNLYAVRLNGGDGEHIQLHF
ncbi:MAG: hypothetical protein AB1546_16600 [bacterium]